MLCLPVPRSSQRVWLDSGAEESQLPSACFSKPADTVLVSPVLPSISDVTSAVPGMDADSRMVRTICWSAAEQLKLEGSIVVLLPAEDMLGAWVGAWSGPQSVPGAGP